jgi:hypothetical protein
VDELFVVKVAHALGYLRGDVNKPIEIGGWLWIRVRAKVFVQAHATTQRHDNGALGWFEACAYEENEIVVARFTQIEHLVFETFELGRIFAARILFENKKLI